MNIALSHAARLRNCGNNKHNLTFKVSLCEKADERLTLCIKCENSLDCNVHPFKLVLFKHYLQKSKISLTK